MNLGDAEFYITDQQGVRRYERHTKNAAKIWGRIAMISLAPSAILLVLLLLTGGFQTDDKGDPSGSGYIATLCGMSFLVSFISISFWWVWFRLVCQIEHEKANRAHDLYHTQRSRPEAGAVATQQPHGHGHDEGTI